MDTVFELLAMGGYGRFVWPAYGATALILIGLLVSTLRQLRANERAAAALERERPRRRRTVA